MAAQMKATMCTIIAKNYLSFARTLCNSFINHHPDGKCYVLIIDDIAGYVDPQQEKFAIVNIESLGIPDIQKFCFKYNITELSTAVKPYLMHHLFSTTDVQQLLYLDPDILVMHPLDSLYSMLIKHDIILTSHLDKDYPDDGKMPNDAHIMKSGIFNLGFIGLRKCLNVDTFLRWWQGKLYNNCVIDHAAGYFVDQKFIDMAIVLFPNIHYVQDIGYNVAYWNLHSRTVQAQNATWTCNGEILYFYHFSNYKPDKPLEISGHQTRMQLANLPDLQMLFFHYKGLLISNGYHSSSIWPYSFNYFRNGKIINDSKRKLYRSKMSTIYTHDPFDWRNYSTKQKALFIIYYFYYNMGKIIGWAYARFNRILLS